MQRTGFDPELDQFRESARRFFQGRIAPHGEKWREQQIVDREAYLAAGEMGYLCMWVDEKYGGLGLKDMRYEQILLEENVWHGDRGFFIWLHSRLVAPYIDVFGTEEQKRRLYPDLISGRRILAIAMTEPDAGSDLAGMKSRAVEAGDHWVLNGSKTYISNGINADVVVVAARTDPDKPHGLTLFLVERGMEGFERGRNLKKMGLKSQDTAELFFHDLRVPKANVLGQPHAGFKHLMHGLPEERLLAAIYNIASAQLALRITVDFVRERRAFGQALSAYQNTRFKLAEIKTRTAACRAFVDQCIALHLKRELTPEMAAMAKLYATEAQGRAVDELLQLYGGYGFMREFPIARAFVDSRVQRIYGGTSEIMKEIIARTL